MKAGIGRLLRLRWLLLSAAALVVLVVSTPTGRDLAWAATRYTRRWYSVAERVEQYGPAVRRRWKPYFQKAGVTYPPAKVVLAAFKADYRLEVYAASRPDTPLVQLRTLPIRGASGELGPKLRQGDKQVPEGIYDIESFNPNSRFHLSLRLGYPNAFDREMGAREGRAKLGGDIMIHGSVFSSGCLAMGDQVAEDLFILVAETGKENVKAILAPVDFRRRKYTLKDEKAWVGELYQELERALRMLPGKRG